MADEYIHQIYKKNKIGYLKIKKAFGKEYVNSKEVDRKKLGSLVFTNSKYLKKLNNITLPLIRDKIIELKNKKELFFCELAIYINHEKYFKKYFVDLFINANDRKERLFIAN
ncbi:MAG: dephospho-CoA kinase, partial [Mycoplasmoidaceae bacterium]|nr:dephospho-CoA kinase [Mycoplasmoidaceae bacterium]